MSSPRIVSAPIARVVGVCAKGKLRRVRASDDDGARSFEITDESSGAMRSLNAGTPLLVAWPF